MLHFVPVLAIGLAIDIRVVLGCRDSIMSLECRW